VGSQTCPLCSHTVPESVMIIPGTSKSYSLDAICARVLMVSSGCPTRTCAAPPALPAMSSFIVACVERIGMMAGMVRTPGGGGWPKLSRNDHAISPVACRRRTMSSPAASKLSTTSSRCPAMIPDTDRDVPEAALPVQS